MQELTALSTEYPVLLFPVRVQTKFLPSANGGHELCVRFYPDQISLDTHQPALSEQEVAAGQRYWRQEGEEWQQPESLALRPTLHSLSSWRRLVAAYGARRGQWVVEQTTPSNLAALVSALASPDVDVPEPTFAEQPVINPESSTGPLARALPDYFTVTLYQQYAAAADIPADPLLQAQLLGNLAAPYSRATFPEPTTELLRPVRTVRAADIPAVLPVGFNLTGSGSAPTDTTLTGLDDRMAWMVDYDEAVRLGLAVTISLDNDEFAQGFERLVVLGTRTAGDAASQARLVEDLLQAHAHTDGLALVAQGTPTNNTDRQASGYGSNEQFDAEATFPLLTQASLPRKVELDPARQPDGQRLSAALGLAPATLSAVAGFLTTDAREAVDLNGVLWPATYGYFLEEMMRPLFSPAATDWTRDFFAPHVLGRGPLPTFRVGNTPYGVLPTTRFSTWSPAASLGPYGQQLTRTLRRLDLTWTERLNRAGSYPQNGAAGVPLPAQPTDYRNLLTVLGAEATSGEFYQRYMLGPNLTDTLDALAKARGRSIWPAVSTEAAQPERRTTGRFDVAGAPANPLYREFLRLFDADQALGLAGAGQPRVFDQAFQKGYTKLAQTYADEPAAARGLGVLIDEFPFSETQPLQSLPGTDRNFIQWLADPSTSFDDIRRQNFAALYPGGLPTDFVAPNSLLYHLLRRAVLQQYWDAAARTMSQPAGQRAEPELFNVLGPQVTKWQLLYERPALAGGQPLHAYLRGGSGTQGAQLASYFQQLDRLALLPTARLERLLAEHLDLGNYRLDAWQVGQVSHRLQELRQARPTGIYCGAFGWLENVRATDRSVPGPDGIREDPDNLGYIHAPAPNQAVTAAILRQGYKSRQFSADPAAPDGNRLAVNLSSARVREALAILEGIRGGASLSALLGQHFERGLTQTAGQVSGQPYGFFLRYFRARFPYALAQTAVGDPASAAAVTPEQAARQVVDGLALLRTGTALAYPYAMAQLPADAGLAAAVSRQIALLQDTVDALGDLAVSEGVYQATQGNADRTGAMLESIAKGKFPVVPDVITPPRAGKALTHRVLLHLPTGNSPSLSPWGTNRTPRALAEPGLNRWLAAFFGDPNQLLFEYELAGVLSTGPTTGPVDLPTEGPTKSPGDGPISMPVDSPLEFPTDGPTKLPAEEPIRSPTNEAGKLLSAADGDSADNFEPAFVEEGVSLASLGLQPIDLLFLLDSTALRKGSALDALLVQAAREQQVTADPGMSGVVTVNYATGGALALHRLLPLAGRLRQLLGGSRPARPEDFTLPGSAVSTETPSIDETQARGRLDSVVTVLQVLADELRNALRLPTLEESVRRLRELLGQAVVAGIAEAVTALGAEAPQLAEAAAGVRLLILARIAACEQALNATEETSRRLEGAAQQLLGKEFRLALQFELSETSLSGPAVGSYRAAVGREAALQIGEEPNPLLMQEWLQGVARVRESLDHLDKVMMLHELLHGDEPAYSPLTLRPTQLSAQPAPAPEYWLGLSYPAGYVPAGDALSLVQLRSADYNPAAPQYALWLDEWTETLPEPEVTTAVAFHYDQPNSEPPQSLLLAVSPRAGAGVNWSFEELLGTVNETLDLAKKRTVEPDALAFTHLATLLPALVAPVAQQDVTFSLDFGQLTGRAQYQADPLLPE